jgi:hypothetical protein
VGEQLEEPEISSLSFSPDGNMERVWDAETGLAFLRYPPVLSPTKLPESEPAMRSPITYEAPWTYVEATSTTRFRLPSTFSTKEFSIHEGKIEYEGWDDTVIIIDCTHLL